MSISTPIYHVQCLLNEFNLRKTKNSRYSLRSYARFLEMDPSALSRVFSGNQFLSVKAAALVLRKFEMIGSDRHAFAVSVADERRADILRILLGDKYP